MQLRQATPALVAASIYVLPIVAMATGSSQTARLRLRDSDRAQAYENCMNSCDLDHYCYYNQDTLGYDCKSDPTNVSIPAAATASAPAAAMTAPNARI